MSLSTYSIIISQRRRFGTQSQTGDSTSSLNPWHSKVFRSISKDGRQVIGEGGGVSTNEEKPRVNVSSIHLYFHAKVLHINRLK